jgi:outer membrane protein assembly factor BamB
VTNRRVNMGTGAPMAQSGTIFIGIAGTVVALDGTTGGEVWRCELKGRDFVNVVVQDGDLYASAAGELFCLDSSTGNIRWRNPLKGLGWGLITIASSDSRQSVVMHEKQQRDENAAASGTGGAT